MNPIPEKLPPVDQSTFACFWADYQYAPGLGCHLRTIGVGDDHLLLTPMITLDKPLCEQSSYTPIHTGAKASSHQRVCQWWQLWYPVPTKTDMFLAYERQGEETFMLVFVQHKPQGHASPFRLIVYPLTECGPKQNQLWQQLDLLIQTLPPIH